MIDVIYIDDEPALLALTKHFLESTKEFRVETTESATEGLRRIAEHRFDAIVSDYQMEEMDGIAFLKTLRSRGDDTPFVLFTGKGREDVAIEALNNGADFYLQKGGNPRSQFAELSNMIRRSVSSRRSDAALRESEEKYRQLAESAADIIFIVDPVGRVSYVNGAGTKMIGRPLGEGAGTTLDSLAPLTGGMVTLARVSEVIRTGKSTRLVDRVTAGAEAWFDLLLVPLRDSSGKATSVMGIARDISELKKGEARMARLNRMYATLSRVNETIVRVRNVESLFMEICRAIVETGRFRMAWVGTVDHSSGAVKVVASFGVDRAMLDSQTVSFRDVPHGQGPTGRAIRSGKIVVVNDIENDPDMALWRNTAAALGCRSTAVIPIFTGRVVVASMAIYSEEVGFFDAQEADLLNEVSFDLSFALDSLDRDRAVSRVEDTIACHSSVIDSMMEAVIVSDENSSITAWNKAAEGALGWTAGEVLRRDVRTLLKPEWAGMGEEDAKGLLESTGHLKGRASFATKTGGEVTADATVDTVRDAHGRTRGLVTIIKTDADLGVGDRDG